MKHVEIKGAIGTASMQQFMQRRFLLDTIGQCVFTIVQPVRDGTWLLSNNRYIMRILKFGKIIGAGYGTSNR